MNQILDYNPNKKSGKSSGSDKIVRVFAIILIVFALCLVGSGAYGIYKRNQESKTTDTEETKATIEVVEQDSQATIKVIHDKAIEKIVYSWNNSSERTIKGTGKSTMEETISLPAGENTLNIKVIDINGVETTFEKIITSENGVDILNPVIELSITDDKKLKITAKDETSLDFITYRWNTEAEEKVEASEDDSKKIEIEIEILKGTNDLTIVAVDSSNNTTTETKSFTGVTKPEITVTLSAEGDSLDILAKHENGIKEVKFNFNDVDYTVDIGTETPKEIQFVQQLEVGYNRIILTVISVDGTETVFDGECNYELPAEENNASTEQTSSDEEESVDEDI